MQVLKKKYCDGVKNDNQNNFNGTQKLRRACEECTRSKVRCSGSAPCVLCIKRSCKCVYQPRRKRQKKNDAPAALIVSGMAPVATAPMFTSSGDNPGLQALQALYRQQQYEQNGAMSGACKNGVKEESVHDASKGLVDLNVQVSGQNGGLGSSSNSMQIAQADLFAACGIVKEGVNNTSRISNPAMLQSGQIEKQMQVLMKDMQIGRLSVELSKSLEENRKTHLENARLREQNARLKEELKHYQSLRIKKEKENVR